MRIRHGARLAPAGRGAFTVIELLVVISIIAVLAALTTAAVMRFRVTALAFSTKTNLGKIQGAMVSQSKAVTDAAKTGSMDSPANLAFRNQAIANIGKGEQDARVKAEFVRLKGVQAFPMSFAEVFAPGNNAALQNPAYVQYLSKMGVSATTTGVGADVQSAVCVLMIVEVGPKSGALTGDDLGATTVGTITVGGGPLRCVVDGWRNPVTFTRQDPVPEIPGKQAAVPMKVTLTSPGNDGKLGTSDDVVINNP